MYLKPAAALLALLYAEPTEISHALRVQQESLKKSSDNELLTRLLLSAEAHRAMKSEAEWKKRIGRVGPRLRERHERLLAASGVNDENPQVMRSVHDEGVSDSENAECDPELDSDDPDVGTLIFTGCGEDYTCAPSELSSQGGICVPAVDAEMLSGRHLQASCLQLREQYGCPLRVCRCLNAGETFERQICFEAVTNSFRNGKLVNNCTRDDRARVYAQAYGEYYACLDDTYGADALFAEGNNIEGTGCFCEYYNSMCDQLQGPCAMGNSTLLGTLDACERIGDICQLADSGCVVEPTLEPTAEPTSSPQPSIIPSQSQYPSRYPSPISSPNP